MSRPRVTKQKVIEFYAADIKSASTLDLCNAYVNYEKLDRRKIVNETVRDLAWEELQARGIEWPLFYLKLRSA